MQLPGTVRRANQDPLPKFLAAGGAVHFRLLCSAKFAADHALAVIAIASWFEIVIRKLFRAIRVQASLFWATEQVKKVRRNMLGSPGRLNLKILVKLENYEHQKFRSDLGDFGGHLLFP